MAISRYSRVLLGGYYQNSSLIKMFNTAVTHRLLSIQCLGMMRYAETKLKYF